MATAAHDRIARMPVVALALGPLPHVTAQVETAAVAGAGGKLVHRGSVGAVAIAAGGVE